MNQVIQSYQPDHDSVSYVYYDILSRPVLSQDGKQRQQNKYSYTIYDSLGRIKEVGQIQNSTPITRKDAVDSTFVNQFLNNGVKSEVTFTWYDRPIVPTLNQTRLRNRIAAVSFCPDGDSLNPESATHYSYDIHGNVKRLVQDIPNLATYDRRFTVLDYEYDLISGNVNRVWFQKGKLEQFSHRYRYDADNRVTHVYTTNIFKVKRDSAVSQERLEARYFYLPTGALSRIELGHKQIQGVDYAYTLQGWLKDINGYRGVGTEMFDNYDSYDIGNDGVIQTDNVNRLFAHDGYASSIQYYQGDYSPVVGSDYFNDLSFDAVSLYNGNISALSESIYNLGEKGFLKLFRYDKLNRIKRMRTAAHHQNNPGWETASDNFATDYSYDWNGNLLFLRRNKQSGQEMHNIRYTYPNGNNRLGSITSTGIASSAYQYDALGNLVRDNAEGLTVGWNAMGKVDTIRRNGDILSTFRYSPTGQRQVKTDSSETTIYIHDATGNVMCVYKLRGDTLTATERYLYGSKRLGMLEQQVWITANRIGLQDSNTIGVRVYEFTDHLGNVTYTAQDRKWLVQDSLGQRQFIPFTVNYTDYYPFGFPMPGRSFTMGGYRYFFNGQEADNEVLGEGVSLTAEFWQYDSRLGRRWNVDPVFKEYESPYACFAGNPVWFADPRGRTIDPESNDNWNKQKQQITETIVDRIFQVVTNTEEDNPSYIKKSIMGLFMTLSVMDQMESNRNWTFALLPKSEGTTGYTQLTRDPNRDMMYLFRIGYVNTANFVHEVTHCGQFLSGKVVFEEYEGGFGAYVDIYDEIDAYKSQFYYNQFSLPLNDYPVFTEKWLRDIKDDEGKYPYRKDGIISFDKFATKKIMQEAYPDSFEEFEDMKGPLMCKPRTVSN
ncbi:MAG: hypothetical protein K5890_10850 [Bacteroidales bacterium]|nr:hypothetical protein [Bacteroidales bacterium]